MRLGGWRGEDRRGLGDLILYDRCFVVFMISISVLSVVGCLVIGVGKITGMKCCSFLPL